MKTLSPSKIIRENINIYKKLVESRKIKKYEDEFNNGFWNLIIFKSEK